MEERRCGTCKYHESPSYVDRERDWICGNEDGEYFGLETEYSDKCPDWEEKE